MNKEINKIKDFVSKEMDKLSEPNQTGYEDGKFAAYSMIEKMLRKIKTMPNTK